MSRQSRRQSTALARRQPNKAEASCREAEKECQHEQLVRIPPKRRDGSPDTSVEKKRNNLRFKEREIDKLLGKAARREMAGDADGAKEFFAEASRKDLLIRGDRFEMRVADQTQAREMDVKVKCKQCGEVVGEFDVVTKNGIVKECKADWQQVQERQFLREQALVQRPEVFGPGTVVHFAIPKGTRGRLDSKFRGKANIVGKIQEH